jgi:Family of unknown function (DUF6328)
MTETSKERVDRELIEQLNEFRVALPGVQVLFAFLLVVPFQAGFDQADGLEQALYLIGFISTATASILLIAPSTYHRILFRDANKELMLRTSNSLFLAGITLLGIAITAVSFLVTTVVVGEVAGAFVAIGAAALVLLLWFALPLRRKARSAQTTRE